MAQTKAASCPQRYIHVTYILYNIMQCRAKKQQWQYVYGGLPCASILFRSRIAGRQ